MHSSFIRLRKALDSFLLSICGIAIVSLVCTVTWQVFSRYVLNNPSTITDELSRYLMIWLGLLGGSYLFGRKGHLAITLMSDSIPPAANKILQLVINLLIIIFANLAMLRGGWLLIQRTMQQFSPALQIPMGYVYMILPISAVLISLYIIMNTYDLFAKEHVIKD
ncbi:TRAP transporter small permease [Photobacterium sp. ZSDE20]|uniref:TRAP transporter small permease protein n=1 Tax=Photobacterium pectinilyticum TaxID=2906793 RepID=A0ABT1N8D7_9GAMM|nr:TRAP transporter small permease [Photobacterium sp. ZSDE20]MCQ1061025.1 TRAP transporter small permease [Photobacterium sp. ZSDE20]MDD1829029.1 TRAP transporter small permease [Photobacterium sp. ZSDE20]